VNEAVTFLAVPIATVQTLAAAVSQPLQESKVEPVLGSAVSVTLLPGTKPAVQAEPQLTPAGMLVTSPLPLPLRATDRMRGSTVGITDPPTSKENEAETDRSPPIRIVHTSAPWHEPPQAAKEEPGETTGVRVTPSLSGYAWEQSGPQLIPPGTLDTVPTPFPDTATVRTYEGPSHDRFTPLPGPWTHESFPAPPSRTSFPCRPKSLSFPPPPQITSAPPPPRMRSLPPRPTHTSAWDVPLRTSAVLGPDDRGLLPGAAGTGGSPSRSGLRHRERRDQPEDSGCCRTPAHGCFPFQMTLSRGE
jgi:hypothetical protein